MMVESRLQGWLNLLVFALIFLKTEGLNVSLTYIRSAVAEGAVCLDGSPPAYHFQNGSGDGSLNWLIHMEGGGWCNNLTTCLQRKKTRLGSSSQMNPVPFTGILSNRQQFNPDFFNWNRVRVRYCDGASFTGDVEAVDPKTKLHFRGERVFGAVMGDLLQRGLSKAKNALMSGCSAGGLTSILHCDSFKALLPNTTNVKCLADAGFFINTEDISGARRIQAYFEEVVATHGSAQSLPRSCTSKMRPALCFFPENMAQRIQTPLFILNAAYDSWQVRNVLAPTVADPLGSWHGCRLNFKECSEFQLRTIQDFRGQFLKALRGLGTSSTRGMFIDSCYDHCQSEMQEKWSRADSPLLANTTIAKAVGNWYYDRIPFQNIDCPYPCNPTCRNQNFDTNNPLTI